MNLPSPCTRSCALYGQTHPLMSYRVNRTSPECIGKSIYSITCPRHSRESNSYCSTPGHPQNERPLGLWKRHVYIGHAFVVLQRSTNVLKTGSYVSRVLLGLTSHHGQAPPTGPGPSFEPIIVSQWTKATNNFGQLLWEKSHISQMISKCSQLFSFGSEAGLFRRVGSSQGSSLTLLPRDYFILGK